MYPEINGEDPFVIFFGRQKREARKQNGESTVEATSNDSLCGEERDYEIIGIGGWSMEEKKFVFRGRKLGGGTHIWVTRRCIGNLFKTKAANYILECKAIQNGTTAITVFVFPSIQELINSFKEMKLRLYYGLSVMKVKFFIKSQYPIAALLEESLINAIGKDDNLYQFKDFINDPDSFLFPGIKSKRQIPVEYVD